MADKPVTPEHRVRLAAAHRRQWAKLPPEARASRARKSFVTAWSKRHEQGAPVSSCSVDEDFDAYDG